MHTFWAISVKNPLGGLVFCLGSVFVLVLFLGFFVLGRSVTIL